MPLHTRQREAFEQAVSPQSTLQTITVGTVVDTNDPHQMGRIRVCCQQWGDTLSSNVEDLPWAIYMSPFGGQVQVGTRGPGIQTSEGGVAYGMWAIPKVGSLAVVVCVDGNPMTRMWIGCVFDQFVPHTMPHGRYMFDDHPALEKTGDDAAPYGPYTSTESLIHPLSENLKDAFGNKSEPNYEYRSRGADYSVSGIDVSQLSQTHSAAPDDKGHTHDNWVSTQGYQSSRSDPTSPTSLTDKNYDSHVYSFTTPGFHALSMDDRQENCRVRLRTTSGHQILMDDTNERIYISTAKGDNWIELDQDGNIDVFSSTKINIRSNHDINVTSDDTVRIYGKNGVHIKSGKEASIQATDDVNVKSSKALRIDTQNTYMTSSMSTHLKSGSSSFIEAAQTLNLRGGSQILGDAGSIYLNSGLSSPATPANATDAKWTSRVPSHEPFARGSTKHDYTHEPEHPYDSDNVNRSERGRTISRGTYWRR